MPSPPEDVGEDIMSIRHILLCIHLLFCLDRSCYHNISWWGWAILMKLTGNIHSPVWVPGL